MKIFLLTISVLLVSVSLGFAQGKPSSKGKPSFERSEQRGNASVARSNKGLKEKEPKEMSEEDLREKERELEEDRREREEELLEKEREKEEDLREREEGLEDAEKLKGLEKQQEKKASQVEKELGKGSERGQEARSKRKKWWKFWDKEE